MPVWKARIGMHDGALEGDTDFSFNIHVEAASTAAAWARAENVAASLLGTVLPPAIVVTSIGVSNPDVVNGTLIIPQATPGERAVTGLVIPQWNVGVIKLAPALGERMHTFYIRMGLTEDDIAGQDLVTAASDALADLVTSLLAIGACCDKDGFTFAYGTQRNEVHMRQMSWRRRTRPGFKRGWVAA